MGTFGNEVLGIDLQKPQILWRYQNPQRQFPFYASAAVVPGAVVIGGRDKAVHALDPQSGEVLWTYIAGGRVDSSPLIVAGRVFFGTEAGALVALDLQSGAEIWNFATGAAVTASPAIAAGRLIIGAADGILYCFGREIKEHE